MPSLHVHYTLTLRWAIEEGMSEADAAAVARADAEVDRIWPGRRHWARHFNPMAIHLLAGRYAAEAARLEALGQHEIALVALGRALHSLQDGLGHGRLGLAHLKHRAKVIRRHPDDWDAMPAKTQAGIERLTRDAIREFLAVSGSAK